MGRGYALVFHLSHFWRHLAQISILIALLGLERIIFQKEFLELVSGIKVGFLALRSQVRGKVSEGLAFVLGERDDSHLAQTEA